MPHSITSKLKELGDPTIAEHAQRFFKTGPGEYGEGDQFLGIRVPALRKLAKEHREMPQKQVTELLQSPWHEVRMTALFIMVHQFERGDESLRESIYRSYMSHRSHINGWDLVDCSAPKIVGPWLEHRDRSILYQLGVAAPLWDRRIAIMSCFHFIRQHDFADTLKLSEILVNDPEDLIHKAVGWMLREVGNRDKAVEETFLKNHAAGMPRVMLRYAIEKFPKEERARWRMEGQAPA